MRAKCIFTPEMVDRLAARTGEDSPIDAGTSKLLDDHASEHGWSWDRLAPDFVAAAQAVPCSDEVLARMTSAVPLGHEGAASEICTHFASALQRAGRLERALEYLEAGISRARATGDGLAVPFANDLEWEAYRLCRRAGKLDLALVRRQRWRPYTTCGTGLSPEVGAGAEVAELLLELGRSEEAAEEMKGITGPESIRLRIECELASGRARTPADALERLRKTLLEDGCTGEELAAGQRLWELRHAPLAVQVEALSELAALEHDRALPVALALDERDLRELSSAFEIEGTRLRDARLADLLAYTGHPALQEPLERAEAQLGRDTVDSLERWQLANKRWRDLRRE